MRAAAIGLVLAFGSSAGVAQAAPPPNDGPDAPGEFAAYTAENGTPSERQAIADLTEAGPDAGVPRCLGAASFARTVWYRVPATSASRTIRIEGSGGSGDTAEVPDLAAFVAPASGRNLSESQACDGPASGGAAAADGGAAAIELRIPAQRSVLVQAGRSDGQTSRRIVLSLASADLSATPRPKGDAAGDAPTLPFGDAERVALGGATLTEEDPAQPGCAAAATVWRRTTATRTGTQTAAARGGAAGTLTAFVGARPDADTAVDCVNRSSAGADLVLPFQARAGDPVWLRVGSDAPKPDSTAELGIAGPGEDLPAFSGPSPGGGPGGKPGQGLGRRPRIFIALPGGRSARRYNRARRIRIRLRATRGAFGRTRVSLQRRVSRTRYRTVARGRVSRVRTGRRTVRVLRLRGSAGRLRRGRYRVVVSARPTSAPTRTLRFTKVYGLR